MRNLSLEEQILAKQAEMLRANMSKFGRWHLRRRKADSTRIWKKLYRELEELMAHKYPFHIGTPIIELDFSTSKNQYTIIVHHPRSTTYTGYLAKDPNHNKIISELNSALFHYGLAIVEKPAEQKRRSTKNLPTYRLYEVKFVESN